MINLRQILQTARLSYLLYRANGLESRGHYDDARALLQNVAAPDRIVALRDAYLVKLAWLSFTRAVLDEGFRAHPLSEMQRLIYEAQTRRWYKEPADQDEQYAARYVDLLEAATLAGGERCNELTAGLRKLKASEPFKSHLPVPS
jgi:hypothetical protein